MKINKDTVKCISIAERPGAFGVRFHNQGYEAMGLNQIYLPMEVKREELEVVVDLVRRNIKGCSVSMPHKIAVMDYLDELDLSAKSTGACNTILNLGGGRLRGYNTDYFGAKTAIESKVGTLEGKRVLMLGAGGVARAVGRAVKDLGGELVVSNRTLGTAQSLSESLGCRYLLWEQRNKASGHLLINATSIGMRDDTTCPVDESTIQEYGAVMDVVASNKTRLINKAEESGLVTITGKTMTIHQAERQFEIYTGEKLLPEFIARFLEE